MFSLLPFLVYWLAVQEGLRVGGPGGPGGGQGLSGGSLGGFMGSGGGVSPLQGPLGSFDADAMALTPAVFDSQIEECMPQIATLLACTKVDGPPDTMRRNRWIEQQVIEKCTSNVHLGLKLYWLLRAALGHLEIPTRRGLPQITGERQRAHLMNLLTTGETLARGGRQSPGCLASLRARYFAHCTNFVAALVKLSFELKGVSSLRRLTALQQGIDRVNTLLFRLMHTRGEEMEGGSEEASSQQQPFYARGQRPPPSYQPPPPPLPPYAGGSTGSTANSNNPNWLNEEHIARQCPEVAAHSVHLPMLDGANPIFRFLRLVSGECELLPSRERCPYMVVAELLQTERNTRCGSARLYTNGATLGCSIWDALDQRQFPESLLYPDDHPAMRFPMKPFLFNNDYDDDQDYFLDLHATPLSPSYSSSSHRPPPPLRQQQQQQQQHPSFPPFFTTEEEALSAMDPRQLDPGTRRAVTVRKVFGELWHWKEQRIRNSSPFGRLEGWRLAMFIVKAGDDLRQEQVAMQLITLVRDIFKEEGLDLWLRPYGIVCVGDQAGLIEAVADAKSIDHVKKRAPYFTDLREYYERIYGGPYSRTFREAQRNFMRSLAGYCICTYLLQVKDRHNANILIDKQGHLIHIDFGFMLGASPGSISFESAPFKLTKEYVDLMGGQGGQGWLEFRSLVVRGFDVLNRPRHRRRLLDMMAVSIFEVPSKAALLDSFDKRLMHASFPPNALALVDESYDNYRTKMYDSYQKRRNGIW